MCYGAQNLISRYPGAVPPGTARRSALPYSPTIDERESDNRSRSNQMEKVMTTQSRNTQTRLSDNELNAVSGGHQKFHYETMNGSTYAIGHINGRTVMVKVS